MKCICCGNEVTTNDRYCKYCGQNNDYYVSKTPNTNQERNNYTPVNYSNYNNYQQAEPRQMVIEKNVKYESSTIGVLAIVFGALGGWLGLLFAIIGLSQYKEKNNRLLCKIGLGLFIFNCIIQIILMIIYVNVFLQYLQ